MDNEFVSVATYVRRNVEGKTWPQGVTALEGVTHLQAGDRKQGLNITHFVHIIGCRFCNEHVMNSCDNMSSTIS